MTTGKQTVVHLVRDGRAFAQFCRYACRRLWRRLRNAEIADLVRPPAENYRAIRGAWHRAGFAIASQFGDRVAARDSLQAAARAAPEDDSLQFALSRACLNAGERDAAEQAMRRVLTIRSRILSSASLAQSLAQLRVKPAVRAPRSALQWAWRNFSHPSSIRWEWERAARFGLASNKLIWTWANCAPDRRHELDDLILPMDQGADRALRHSNRGLLLLGAHVGVPHAGVYYFRAREYRIRIFGREPGISALGTERFYINSDDRLALRQVLRAIDDGVSVGLLADAPRGPTSAETRLAGHARLRLMPAIAKMIWRHRISYAYCFAIWQGERIRILVDRDVPEPQDGEPYDDWEHRWVWTYREKVLAILRREPQNLRLSGGLWSQFS